MNLYIQPEYKKLYKKEFNSINANNAEKEALYLKMHQYLSEDEIQNVVNAMSHKNSSNYF